MSRSTPKSFALPATALDGPDPQIHPGEVSGPLDLTAVFGRAPARLEVEVGYGKGRLLLELAAAHPDTSFLGIERARPFARLVRHKVLRHELRNVRLMVLDAGDVFRRLLPKACIDRVNVLFPDPWPKRRHNDRRLIQPPFLTDVARCLQPDGVLNIATDHEGYWPWILEATAATPELEPLASFELGDDLVRRTNFAIKRTAAGATIHYRSWRRRR